MARYFYRKKVTPITKEIEHLVDYKNIDLLKEYLSETGAILPSRITGTSNKHQRMIAKQIKIARFLALLPYSVSHLNT